MRKFYLLFMLVCLLLANNKLLAECDVLISSSTTHLNCRTTAITLIASGSITYVWKYKPDEESSEEAPILSVTDTYIASKAGIYIVYGSYNEGDACSTVSKSVTIISDPVVLPVVTAAAFPSTICAGGTATLVGLGAVNYTWQIEGQKSAPFTGNQLPVILSETTTYLVTGEDVNGCKADNSVVITVNPLPTASIDGTTTVCKNTDPPLVAFRGANSKTPLTFAYNVNDGKTQTVTTGDAAVGIEVPTRAAGTYNYRLLSVTDGNGCLQSDNAQNSATVKVAEKALLTSDQTRSICDGSLFHYEAKSSANKTTYSWTRAYVKGIEGDKKESSGEDSIINETLVNTTYKPLEVIYQFTLSTGSECITIEQVKVTVNPTPVMDIIQGMSFCNGKFVSEGIPFTSTEFPDASFTWRTDNTDIGLTTGNGRGSIPPFLAKNNDPNNNVKTANITIDITAAGSGCPGQGQPFKITVRTGAVFESEKTKSICDNSGVDYTAIVSPNTITSKNWYRPYVEGIDGGPVSVNDIYIGERLHNKTSNPLVVPYTFQISSGAGCDITEIVQVTVNPTPVIDPIGGNKVYCNRDFVTGGIPFTSKSPNASFSWTNNNTSIGLDSKGVGNILPFNVINNTNHDTSATITVSVVASTSQCKGADSIFIIKVRPAPAIVSPKTAVICNNSVFEDTVKSSAISTRFNWTRSPVTGLTPTSNSGTTGIIKEMLYNSDAIPKVVEYAFKLFIDTSRLSNDIGCTTLDTIRVTVNPTPEITPLKNLIFCNGDVVDSIKFSSLTKDVSFSWTGTQTVGFGIEGRDKISKFTATNLADTAVVDTISIKIFIANNEQCRGRDTFFTITVNPSPPRPNFTSFSRYPDNQVLPLCNLSENINFNVNTPANGVSYKWTTTPGNQMVFIRDTNDVNTVISFRGAGTDTVKVTANKKVVPTDTTGCTTTVSQIVVVNGPGVGINKSRIILMQPGNLLVYPNNSLPAYQWGYDSVIHTSPDSSFGPSIPIPGQVYQFFIPGSKFLNNDNTLNEKDYLYWVLLSDKTCATRVYYKGPYASRLIETAPVDSTVQLQIMPNPNNGNFEIALKGSIYGNINAQVYNAMGQVVFRKSFVKGTPSIIEKINTSHLPGGLYFLVLYSSNNKKITSRFIIQR